MKKILVILILCLTASTAQAGADEQLANFAGSVIITTVTYLITGDVKKAVLIGAGAGLAKELYDSRDGGPGFSAPNLAADAAGVVVGIGLSVSSGDKLRELVTTTAGAVLGVEMVMRW